MFFKMAFLVPVLLPTLVIKATSQNNTHSDVFVKYSGHAEADELPHPVVVANQNVITTGRPFLETDDTPTTTNVVYITTTTLSTRRTTPMELPEETEGVIFVPNESPIIRLEDQYDRSGTNLRDLLSKRTLNDLVDGRNIRIETEPPVNEIFFVPGSNNENTEKKIKEERDGRRNEKEIEEKKISHKAHKLDCTNLDCNNSMKTICGGKIVDRKLRYRLFLNDCYFRKVNCNFKYEINRYSIVPSEKCVKYEANGERPFIFTRKTPEGPKKKEDTSLRRSFSSRRSMAMNVNGQFCSHPCPVSCPEDYEPECAVSSTGQRRVFMNHCKLDDNSCLFAIVWHLRPLSECVGGKKADMRQNRFFIGWMQQVGILDNKGRLVLE